MSPLEFAQAIGRIQAYPAAAAYGEAAAEVNLASNESPEPPLPAVVEAVSRTLRGLNRYPDPGAGALRARLSDRYGIPAARIAVGNGSCDLLLAAGEALLEPGAEMVHAWPSFSIYPHLSAATGARAITVALDGEDRHDLPAMAREVTAATQLVVVCNPNNPTATAVGLTELAAWLREIPGHVAVIVDEAYCEFNTLEDPDASIDLLVRHPNLVLLRTFSKVHGLCGLRVGFALCGSERLRAALDQVRQPFSVNAPAQAAALEALGHSDEVTRRVERTIARRLGLEEGLAELGIRPSASQANFVWLGLPDGADEAAVVGGLAQRGVMVRAGGALGRGGWLRVTVGLERENDRFLAALGEILG